MPTDATKVAALINWMVAGAPPRRSFSDLITEISERIAATGLPVDQFGVYHMVIHPEYPGWFDYWTRRYGHRRITITHDQVANDAIWAGGPAARCLQTARLVTHSLGQSPEFDDRPASKSQLGRGYTQFIYQPLYSSYCIETNVGTFGTKQPGGFDEDQKHALRLIQAPLARVIEAYVLYESNVQVLSTYVGRDAGVRVLEGGIQRGDSEEIPSIVLFTDLRNFTALSNTRPAKQVIETLNTFYDIAESAIRKNGGEILKFMGDGLLAIFPTPDDLSAQMAAASGAVSALEETRAILRDMARDDLLFRAALHLGDIHYGNIGSKARLDFTAVGPAVNLAARLLSVADDLGSETVCSDMFQRLVPSRTTYLAERTFKGFDQAHRVFGIDA